jgi:hypothetical protein
LQQRFHPNEIFERSQFGKHVVEENGNVLAHVIQFSGREIQELLKDFEHIFQVSIEIEIFSSDVMTIEDHRIGLQIQHLIDRNAESCAKLFDFFKGKLFLSPDPSVCAVVADVQQFGDGVYEG